MYSALTCYSSIGVVCNMMHFQPHNRQTFTNRFHQKWNKIQFAMYKCILPDILCGVFLFAKKKKNFNRENDLVCKQSEFVIILLIFCLHSNSMRTSESSQCRYMVMYLHYCRSRLLPSKISIHTST